RLAYTAPPGDFRDHRDGERLVVSADRVAEGFADFRGYRTWYRITGSLDAAKRPVVILHGGPAAGTTTPRPSRGSRNAAAPPSTTTSWAAAARPTCPTRVSSSGPA